MAIVQFSQNYFTLKVSGTLLIQLYICTHKSFPGEFRIGTVCQLSLLLLPMAGDSIDFWDYLYNDSLSWPYLPHLRCDCKDYVFS